MKNIITKGIFVFIFVVLCFLNNARANLNSNGYEYHLKYKIEDLCITTIEKDSRVYSQITLKDLQNIGEIGQPSLPVQTMCISIPSNADNIHVSTIINKSQNISIQGWPMPEQEPLLSGMNQVEPEFIHLNQDLSVIQTPKENKGIIQSTSIFGGCHKVVYINFNPIVWNPDNNSIAFVTDASFSLTWEIEPNLSEKLKVPKYQATTENAISQLEQFVLNPEDVRGNIPSVGSNRQYVGSLEDQRIPYIIVTTKKLSSSLERLAAFRRLRGINTQVRCIEDILSNPQYIAKAQEDEYKDDASILRAFVSDAYYNMGTESILLAGPYPTIPGRWAQRNKGTDPHDSYISDFYFRNVDTYWPKIEDRYPLPSELGNNFENYINVGRIPCSSAGEINNYIDKLIQYEYNVAHIDLSYLNNAFVLFGDDNSIYSTFNTYSAVLYNEHFSYLKTDTNGLSGKYTGAEAVISMNSDFWGFVDWRCHGHYAGLATNNPSYGINALDSHQGKFSFPEENNGLDNWNNYLRPCWTISMSCNLSELGIVGVDTYNVAQSFILGKHYGGVAFISNNGPGYIGDSSNLSQKIFQNSINKAKLGCIIPYSGEILNDGIDQVKKVSYKYLITNIGLTGDPLVPLWTKEPNKSSLNGKFSPQNIYTGDKVIYGKNNFGNSFSQTGEGVISDYQNIPATTNYTLLNYRSDMLPYIHPCNISGLSLFNSGYWFTGKLSFMGDSSNENKSLSLPNAYSATFECLEEVDMAGKINIVKGGSVNIKAHSDVSIMNCEIEGGGALTIESNVPVVLGKSSTISKGTCISIR